MKKTIMCNMCMLKLENLTIYPARQISKIRVNNYNFTIKLQEC